MGSWKFAGVISLRLVISVSVDMVDQFIDRKAILIRKQKLIIKITLEFKQTKFKFRLLNLFDITRI